eukprot:TRINITY_DN6618_c0_g1_i2.p1 TRINITY_DN6618_c0_g1~~TRINITY_DN6618_c0_g1_i2.p1  ORF type:complete len:226 (-),score=-0.25 TRINITY_DN6618_c0_g1_i2:218-895(-)
MPIKQKFNPPNRQHITMQGPNNCVKEYKVKYIYKKIYRQNNMNNLSKNLQHTRYFYIQSENFSTRRQLVHLQIQNTIPIKIYIIKICHYKKLFSILTINTLRIFTQNFFWVVFRILEVPYLSHKRPPPDKCPLGAQLEIPPQAPMGAYAGQNYQIKKNNVQVTNNNNKNYQILENGMNGNQLAVQLLEILAASSKVTESQDTKIHAQADNAASFWLQEIFLLWKL